MASCGTIDIEIYDEFNNILLGSLYNQSYDLPGYYTFDLPAPIAIKGGDGFFVKVKYQTPQFNYPIPLDYKSPIETSKCWMSHDGESWIAMGNGTYYVADLTIKAYTVPQSKSLEVESLTLVNAETDQDIQELQDGDIIDLAKTGNIPFSVRANTTPKMVNFTRFELTGSTVHTQRERKLPYALYGDDMEENYFGQRWGAGNYTLTVTPFSRTQQGQNFTADFEVVWSNSKSSVAFQVYPIPTEGKVRVVHDPKALQLQMLDRVGNILLSQPLSSKAEEIVNLQSFGQGTYYLKVISPQKVEIKRVIVK